MRKKITLMLMALFALAAFAATQVLNQATRRAATEVNVPDGTELGAFVSKQDATNGLVLNLAENGSYTLTTAIKVPADLIINGNGATIDASGLSGDFDFITLNGSTVFAKKSDNTDSDHYLIDAISISGVKITGLKGALVTDAQKTLVEKLTIDNSVIEVPAAGKNVLNFNGKGYVGKVVVKNSTIWANGKNTGFFAQYGSRPKNVNGDWLQEFDVQNSTFVGIANGKNFNNLKQNGTAQNVYTIKNNIFVDCGKQNQVVVGFNNGQTSATPVWDVDGNIFNCNGVDGSEAEVSKAGKKDNEDIVKNSYAGVVEFEDAANGIFNFNLTQEADATAPTSVGDPRWTMKRIGDFGNNVTAAIDVEVPANLGENGGATDLATFLDGYLENSENPAYIKLTLQGGAKYTISKPIETISSISIIANEGNPASIDASALKGALIQVNSNKVSGNPNEKGYYTNIEAVNIKNINVTALNGELFNAAGAKYLIPTLNIENVYVEENGRTIIDMNGSALDEFNVSKSTFFAPAGATFYKAGAALETAGVGTQVVNISYNTLYKVGGFNGVTNDDKAKTNIDFNHNIVVEYPNFIAAMNADLVTLLAQNNSFQQLVNDIYEDISNAEEGATNSIVGHIAFANDPTTGDFALAACDQKTEKIGDPRWLVAVKYITNDDLDAAGDDIAVAINNGIQEGFTKFQLQDNTRYEARQSIVADKGLILAGKNVKIEVLHNDPFILLSKSPAGGFMQKSSTQAAAPALNRAGEVEYTDYYKVDELTLSGLKVNGLKNSIIYDNNVKYCVVDLTIDDCVMQLETEAVKNEALISFQAGGVKDFTIKNSTVYGNNAVAKYFIRYNNSARLDRYGFDKNTEFQTMTYQNNTFYGLLKSDGQWGNYNGIAGQNYSKFVVEKNIWYNSSNEIIRRMAGGRFGSNAPQTFDKNTYFLNGADNSAKEAGYDKSGTALTTDPGFKKPAEGDFTLSAYSAQCNEKTGDPRWFAEGGHYIPVTGIETVKTAEETSLENAVIYNLNGQRVEKAQKGINIVNGKKVIIK